MNVQVEALQSMINSLTASSSVVAALAGNLKTKYEEMKDSGWSDDHGDQFQAIIMGIAAASKKSAKEMKMLADSLAKLKKKVEEYKEITFNTND